MLSPSSPVAMRATITAQPIASAGRFCPFGPLGTVVSPFAESYRLHAVRIPLVFLACVFHCMSTLTYGQIYNNGEGRFDVVSVAFVNLMFPTHHDEGTATNRHCST